MNRFTMHGLRLEMVRKNGIWVLRNVSTRREYPNWYDDGTLTEMRDRLDRIWKGKTPEEFNRAFA